MKRRSKAGGEQIKRRRLKTPGPNRGNAPKLAARPNLSTAGQETEVARLTHELGKAVGQQTATSEVLQLISSSPGDLQRVFATILEKAVGICDAKFGNIYRWEEQRLHLGAAYNTPPAFADARRRAPHDPSKPNWVTQALVANKAPVHVIDAAAQPGYLDRSDLANVAAVELGRVRTLLAVPMLKNSELIGSLTLFQQEVRPFTDRQIALVTNFAAQAVIAIENARLLNELRQRTDDLTERTGDLTEALEQQTATSEVLRVISSFPGDLEPVFTSLLVNAARICDASFGNIFRWDGEALHLVGRTIRRPNWWPAGVRRFVPPQMALWVEW